MSDALNSGESPQPVVCPLHSSGSDRKQKLQDNKITHVLSIHDNAEPEFTVSQHADTTQQSSSSSVSPHFTPDRLSLPLFV